MTRDDLLTRAEEWSDLTVQHERMADRFVVRRAEITAADPAILDVALQSLIRLHRVKAMEYRARLGALVVVHDLPHADTM